MSGRPIISVAKNAEGMSHLAAETISELIARSIHARGISCVALAGGETPLRVYQILAAEPFGAQSIGVMFICSLATRGWSRRTTLRATTGWCSAHW